jgi:hypothetical protein
MHSLDDTKEYGPFTTAHANLLLEPVTAPDRMAVVYAKAKTA